jgi:WD40 repeat protein
MFRAGWFAGCFALLGACSPIAPPPPPPRADVKPAKAEAAPPSAAPRPRTAEDWLALAGEAQKLGKLDVANAHRGQAYTIAPKPETLRLWLEGLLAAGEHTQLRRVWADTRAVAAKGGADLVARLDAQIAALPAAAPAATLAPAPVSAALRAAYEAELDGRLDDAAAAFDKALGSWAPAASATSATPDPYHLVHAADLWWQKGDTLRARQAWSKARVLFREAGAWSEVVPVHRWHTVQTAFHGDKLALVRLLQPIDSPSNAMGELSLWSLSPSARPVLRSFSATSSMVSAFSGDGRLVLQAEGGTVVVKDSLAGTVLRRIDTGLEGLRVLGAVGGGGSLSILAAAGPHVTLWNGHGDLASKHEIEGKTPTISRVYRMDGDGMHDNILRDSPTWIVSAAVSPDLRFVAAGGSDSKVRIFDRTTGAKRTLEITWKYTEHRHMGGNPDRNEPLDMGFTAKGDRLVVAYRRGNLVTWDTSTGAKVAAVPPTCSLAEGTIMANRYAAQGEKARVPTAEDLESCGHATAARLSPDLRSIVTAGSGVRVRSVASGASAAFLIADGLPDDQLAWSPSGALAMVDLYGTVATWSPGDKAARTLVPKADSGPIDPKLSANGRFLSFDVNDRDVVWDLVARKQLPLPARRGALLALSADGKLAAIREKTAVELRTLESGEVLVRQPVPDNERAWATIAEDGKKALLLVEQYPKQTIVLCDLEQRKCAPTAWPSAGGLPLLSADSRWLAMADPDGATHVRELATGKSVLDLGKDVRNVAFSRDGGTVAWVLHPDRSVRRVKANVRRLDARDGAPVPEIGAEGWPQDLAVSADGSDVWVLLEGSLIRWQPGVDSGTEYKEPALILAHRIAVSDSGKTLLLEGYDHVSIRSTGKDVPPLAKLYPLLSGGFLTVSAAGALDGSSDAPANVVTRFTREKETLVFDGLLGWDAAHVEGVLPRALEGESAPPPIATANGDGVTSL